MSKTRNVKSAAAVAGAARGSDASRLEKLLEIKAIIESGWAGVMPNGNIVDRRVHTTAIPIPANPMFGTPEPKQPNAGDERRST